MSPPFETDPSTSPLSYSSAGDCRSNVTVPTFNGLTKADLTAPGAFFHFFACSLRAIEWKGLRLAFILEIEASSVSSNSAGPDSGQRLVYRPTAILQHLPMVTFREILRLNRTRLFRSAKTWGEGLTMPQGERAVSDEMRWSCNLALDGFIRWQCLTCWQTLDVKPFG